MVGVYLNLVADDIHTYIFVIKINIHIGVVGNKILTVRSFLPIIRILALL